MPLESVHDRTELADLLCRTPDLRAYELGDLDDRFWPYTSWYRRGDALALLYHGAGLPILLALDTPDRSEPLAGLLTELLPLLPRRFYAHLSPGLEHALEPAYEAESNGPHLKMALTDPTRLVRADRSDIPAGALETVELTTADLPELGAFYELAYPAHSFAPGMVANGPYLGLRRGGELLAVAGVHVWSPSYRVAALGNVATHPRARGGGLATMVVSALCRRLLATVDRVALNVKAENAPAVGLYHRLGFSPVAEYTELTFTARD
ncbi:putative GNAT family acetyltransferase [Micromonospora pisi]|uniref:Putative GNAT family acetyltransferase n=1 Tax=Micromonospora pisi TaxID=589240 RepID=A0A495JT07_9ACTN|nr:GNAT family N-acetyltransferase [Micromonospora pisi]RKR91209.1 putative GNAT family acetyltransferase [Micromonospora pisi]